MLVIVRIAVANLASGDGEEVLHHEGEPGERALGTSVERRRQSMRDEGVNTVVVRNGNHVQSAWWMSPTSGSPPIARPRLYDCLGKCPAAALARRGPLTLYSG